MTPLISYFAWIRVFIGMTIWALLSTLGINPLIAWIFAIVIGLAIPYPEDPVLTPSQHIIMRFFISRCNHHDK